jgi:hypothetical protein
VSQDRIAAQIAKHLSVGFQSRILSQAKLLPGSGVLLMRPMVGTR